MRTRSQSVTERLRSMILEGDYLPGTHLQEVPLAAAMGVSRTPIRAALAALEKEGLLGYVPKRGYEVRRFEADDVLDMYEVRSVLEGHAASLCASTGLSQDELSELEDCLRIGDAILRGQRLDPDDLPAYRAMNRRLHETVVRGSRSRATAGFVLQMRQIPFLSDRIILWHDFKLIERSHDDHHRVCDAIARRDPIRAGAIMREHVYFMGLVVQQYLTSAQGEFPGIGSGALGAGAA